MRQDQLDAWEVGQEEFFRFGPDEFEAPGFDAKTVLATKGWPVSHPDFELHPIARAHEWKEWVLVRRSKSTAN